jgi:flagellar L-ring protein precursor FlgH
MNKSLSFIFERAHAWAERNAKAGRPANRETPLEKESKQWRRLEGRLRGAASDTSVFRKAAVLAVLMAAPFMASADSLWKPETSKALVADKKASAIGDIITIVVQENNSASKNNNTKTAKSTSVDASISSFLYGPTASGLLTKGGKYPALKAGATTAHDGGGQINNSEQITARVAVRVVDTMPNGTMVVEGRRRTAFSGEKQEMVLRGVVRAEDITANNTVLSFNVADASISFVSNGTVSDSQKKGWFSRAWDKVSPF